MSKKEDDWLVDEDYIPPPKEDEDGNIHHPELIDDDGDIKTYAYPTSNGKIPAVQISEKIAKSFPHGSHVLTHEERVRGGKVMTSKRRLAAYLNGLLNKQNLTPRQREYVKHIKDNNFTGLVKQLTADLLSASDDPEWLHSIYKDLLKMIPKQTIIDMTVNKQETHKFDLTAMGLSPDQQKKLGDVLLDMMEENEDMKTFDLKGDKK